MSTEPEYTRFEIENALLDPEAVRAAEEALKHPANKSKPSRVLAAAVVMAAIEAGFGPK